MFRNLLTIVTMTSVVLHALLGCCVHHAHACCSHGHGAEVAMADSNHVHDHHHGHSHAHHGHSHDHGSDGGHQAGCPQRGVDADSSTCDCFDNQAGEPCSGSHGPHESCDEPNCNIVSDQRDLSVQLPVSFDWTPLLLDLHLVTSQDLNARRTEAFSPSDLASAYPPIRLQKQVWRL